MRKKICALVLAVSLGCSMGTYSFLPASAEETEFEEITVVDNEECVIKITGLEPDNDDGYTVKAYFENKSDDIIYMFSVETASVNGVMDDPYFATEVAAGKKRNSEITFDSADEEIGDYTDIEISFRVYDSDDWSAEDVADETVHIYPYGEENAVRFERKVTDSDIVLVDNDDVTVIVTGFETDDSWSYIADLFLVNKTDRNLVFSSEDDSVNGYMIDPYWAEEVYAGKCAFDMMAWDLDDFEENGIDEVEEIEFALRVYDSDDWSADDILNEIVTINP